MSKKISFDALFLMVVLILLAIGTAAIYSASYYTAQQEPFNDEQYFLFMHLKKMALALMLMFLALKIDYRYVLDISPILLGISMALLVYVLFNGALYNGSRRAVQLGGFSFQPSEFARLALILYFAKFFTDKSRDLDDFKEGLLPALLVLGALIFLVALEPDLGTAVIILIIAMILIFIAGVSLYHLTALGAVAAIGVSIFLKIFPYQLNRIKSYINAIRGTGELHYHIKQSLISFGNGGVFGVGIGNSRQKMDFLPYSYNDFIFSIIGEEIGLIGCLILISLFLLLLWRGIWIIVHTPDKSAQLVAVGVIASITVYAFFNAGIAVNLLPVTGIPMPFISYGGSSLIVNLIGVGLVLNISMQSKAASRRGRTVSKNRRLKRSSRNTRKKR